MRIRFNTLTFTLLQFFVKKAPVFLLLLIFCPFLTQAQPVSINDVKKQANKLYEDDEFTSAYKLYAQLVANFPKDPEFNYRLGVCMIYSEPDKKKCIPYLKAAAANKEDAPKDVHFYLGKAYHINYLFDEAIKYYNEFKKTAPASLQKKLQVDREINACNNGKRLLSSMTDLVVQRKNTLNEAEYFRKYDLSTIGGKLLVKPEELKTSPDKKKKDRSIIFRPRNSDVIYFSSYGENTDNGRDIYTAALQPGGTFSKPQKVAGINTQYDEDYPFLHPDGKTLYFASKGHNSMGGYDIFKTTYNESSNTWSQPVNLEFPINSPDDDFLFVTDSLEKTAYFSTGRQSEPGKIDVLKINTERKPIDVIVIKGSVMKESADQSLSSIISVQNLDNEKAVGTFSAQENGDYLLELPNGAKLSLTVETPGLKTQSKEVQLPLATTAKPYKQTISYDNGILQIRNNFDEEAGDENYLQYLKQIEKKAKLEVNEGENKLDVQKVETTEPLANTDSNGASSKKKSDGPKLVTPDEGKDTQVTQTQTTTAGGNTESAGMDNKQLAELALKDAAEDEQEAIQMKKDAADAIETGNKQKAEAENKMNEALAAIKSAESLTNDEEKKSVIEKAEQLKASAGRDQQVAEKILGYGEKLKEDAARKEKEAALNRQYAQQISKGSNGKNKPAETTKLEDIQKQINQSAEQKNQAENMLNEIKTELDQKEEKLASAEKRSSDIKSSLDEIKTAITDKEAERDKTKKKAAKEEITNQINDLKAEQTEKEKQLAGNEQGIKTLTDEISTLRSEIDIANKIKTEDIAAITETTAPQIVNSSSLTSESSNTTTVAANKEPKTGSKQLAEKYKNRIAVSDPQSTESIQTSNNALKEYNREIEDALTRSKKQQAGAKNTKTKEQLATEIKSLQDTRKQNQQLIAANDKKIQLLTQQQSVQSDQIKTNPYEPLAAGSATEAITKLGTLENSLTFTDNPNFDKEDFGSQEARDLKVKADSEINNAVARIKKLKDEISAAKTEISKAGNSAPAQSTVPAGNPEQLTKEADDLHAQSLNKLNESKNKTGSEKETLVAESRQLEEKSNLKLLEISEITRRENEAMLEANRQNFEALVKAGKSPEADVTEASRLNEEAVNALKKAKEIRAEVSSLSSSGQKLGSISNAEEKEAEADLKMKQAIEILKKNNTDYTLVTPAAVSATAQSSNGSEGGKDVVEEKIAAINQGLNEIAGLKINSYTSLSQANTAEANELDETIKKQQTEIDNNPSTKSEYIAAVKKLDTAKELKQRSEQSTNNSEKLNLLIESVKKQNEGLKQLRTTANKVSQIAANPKNNETPASAATQTTAGNDSSSNTVAKDPPITEIAISETTSPQPTVSVGLPPAATSETKTPELSKEDEVRLSIQDTSAAEAMTYLNEKEIILNNPQAEGNFKKSLNQIRNYQADITSLDKRINKLNKPESGSDESNTPEVMKAKSDTLMQEADALNLKASEKRKEASQKSGAEKDALIAEAKQLEEQALDKSIVSTESLFNANEKTAATNENAINEMLGMLRSGNPELSVELAAKRDEQNMLREQARQLRNEAMSMSNQNRAARLGGINNAEEKEELLLQSQESLLNELKKQFPDYKIKPVTNEQPETASKEELVSKKKELFDQQNTELTNLINALNLEFEAHKNGFPKNLSAEDEKLKKQAQELNAKSKKLLISSAAEKRSPEKAALLSQAVKLAGDAVQLQQKISVKQPVVVSPGTNKENQPTTPEPVVKNPIKKTPDTNPKTKKPETTASTESNKVGPVAPTDVEVPGLKVKKGFAYTEAKPIPVNARIEDGLIFRVQIGAFKTQLPNNTFRGLSPLNAETTPSGFYRYTAGNFNKYEVANAVKNDLRGIGYRDAFVVAYYNGKRISLAEAIDLLNKEGKPVDNNAPQTAGITLNSNVPVAPPAPAVVNEKPAPTREIAKVNGLLFTIQVGVYNRQVSAQQLRYLKPVFTEQMTGGLFRYTAGIYNDADRVKQDRSKVVALGISDAFVTAYLNGKKISFAEARDKQTSDPTIKMQSQEPVIFGGTPENTAEAQPPANNPASVPAPTVQPFSNGVSAYPAATSENGIKTAEEGICFKVQIGAYSKQLPPDVEASFLAIKNWPIENKVINGVYVYNVGNFSAVSFAKQLKDEVAKNGINDAFIVVYKDGRKLSPEESAQYLAQ